MLYVNPNYGKLPGSYLFAEVSRLVSEYQQKHPQADVIKLGIGDATQPIAPAIIEAMRRAVDELGTLSGFRGYGPYEGYDFLIKAIQKGDYLDLGLDVGEDEIFVSDGAKTDTSAIQELFADNVKIAVTDPVYPVYVDSNALSGRLGSYVDNRWDNLVFLPCNAENGFVPPLPKERVDIIYLCLPNNPTGTTLTREQLKPFVDYAKENGALIIYDAAYKAYIHSGAPKSIYEVEGAKDVAIECCSYSKTAGFTGVRCAYMVIPRGLFGLGENGEKQLLNPMWRRRIATKFNGVSYIVQRGAEAVYSESGRAQCQETVEYYMDNARAIRSGLEGAGYACFGGVDAPYIWLKTPQGVDSWEFFRYLLEEKQLVGTPGVGFGPCGEGYFRLTAFGTKENTQRAMERLK